MNNEPKNPIANHKTIRGYFRHTELGRIFRETDYPSFKIQRAMYEEGCETLEDIQSITEERWLKIPGFGKVSMDALVYWISETAPKPSVKYIGTRQTYVGIEPEPELPQMAFPGNYCDGMTLRDWFAGMALQGTLANEVGYNDRIGTDVETTIALIASSCYKYADAMLSEKNK